MRILILTPIYYPEMGALANRMTPIARELTEAGHEVIVATGMPNYPDGVVQPAYRRKLFVREQVDGVTVLRTAYYVTARNRSKWSQFASYASFIPAVLNSGLAAGKVDVVFVTSPPIFPIMAGVTIARLRRAKLIFDVRDLWPDEIVACGAAREGSAIVSAVRRLERMAYREADRVCCTTDAFVRTVADRGADPRKIVYVPNGADLSMFRPMTPDPALAPKLSYPGRFVVMYSGLLGIKHGLETVLDAADLLRDIPDIDFVFVGSGPMTDRLKRQVRDLGLTNVNFMGNRLPSEVPGVIAHAHVCVTALRPEAYLEKIVPAKIYEYMACGKPTVAAISGEGARILSEAKAGYATPPGDAEAMASAIRMLYNDPGLRADLGISGRKYVEMNYSREKSARMLTGVIEELCHAERSARRAPRLAA